MPFSTHLTTRVLARGTLVRIVLRQKIYEAEQLINDVYFLLDCVLSVVARMRHGCQIEVGTIGREGMSAFPLLMGASSTANVCYCQVRGSAIRIPADLFRELAASDPGFRQLLDHYLQAYVNMLGQLAACNRLHTIYERCARWLLMTRDRMDLDAIPLTQEFLAMMLGTGQSGRRRGTRSRPPGRSTCWQGRHPCEQRWNLSVRDYRRDG